MYGLFILGKNQKNLEDKIKLLTEAAEKHPNYVRLVN